MSVEIKKLEDCPVKNPNLLVKVVEMGNIVEIQYMSKRNCKASIRMLEGGNQYLELSTGEIKDVVHHETRADQFKNLYRTFKSIRGIINSNTKNISNVRWITLTYAENMTDTKKLYFDFEKFNKRFQYFIKKLGYDKAEYIVVCEPQGRGAWHCHLLYIFNKTAPFIPNDALERLWGHGFTKIKKLDDSIDNLGAYLTAYLGDMEVFDMLSSGGHLHDSKCKVVEFEDEKTHEKLEKYYVKGARLPFYPANFNMYRCSRGIERPIESMEIQEIAEKKVSGGTLTYEKTVLLSDLETDFSSVINTRQYNMKSKKIQDSVVLEESI